MLSRYVSIERMSSGTAEEIVSAMGVEKDRWRGFKACVNFEAGIDSFTHLATTVSTNISTLAHNHSSHH